MGKKLYMPLRKTILFLKKKKKEKANKPIYNGLVKFTLLLYLDRYSLYYFSSYLSLVSLKLLLVIVVMVCTLQHLQKHICLYVLVTSDLYITSFLLSHYF